MVRWNAMTKRERVTLLLNLYIIVSCVLVCIYGCKRAAIAAQSNPISAFAKVGYFCFFTTLSNVLMAVCALACSLRLLQGKMTRRTELLYYAGTSAVGLTFLIVVVFLSPLQIFTGGSYFDMFRHDGLFFHLLNPAAAVLCFALTLGEHRMERKDRLLCLLPTVAYSLVYLFQVVILQNWPDFYSFTFGGKFWLAPIDLVVMYGISYGVISVVGLLHNRRCGKAAGAAEKE